MNKTDKHHIEGKPTENIFNEIKAQQALIEEKLSTLSKNFTDYYYFYIKENVNLLDAVSLEIGFDIPLSETDNSMFKIAFTGNNKKVHEELDKFDLYLGFIILTPQQKVTKLYLSELLEAGIVDLGNDIIKEEKNKQHKIIQSAYEEKFVDFFDRICEKVVKPYLVNYKKLDTDKFLKAFNDAVPNFSNQLRNQLYYDIFAQNKCTMGSLMYLQNTLLKNEAQIFYNDLDTKLVEKSPFTKKKI